MAVKGATVFSHFADGRLFLIPGAAAQTIYDAVPPGGTLIFGGLAIGTGFREIVRVPKMGKPWLTEGSSRPAPGDSVERQEPLRQAVSSVTFNHGVVGSSPTALTN